jgi:two-component system response regulator LytT
MKNLKVLIVEDEVLIAETIRLYLEEINHIVCAIAISYDEALEAFHLHSPDLVLLDIRLFGEKSGIDLANYLQSIESDTPYIFLTSQLDKRILDLALKTIPYGYIAKPIQKETLWTTIETGFQLFQIHHSDMKIIEISDGKENYKIKINEINYIKSDHVYANIVLEKCKKIIIRSSLQNLHDLLNFEFFVRCHRSYLVNVNYIEKWNRDNVLLYDGMKIPISKSYREKVIERLGH